MCERAPWTDAPPVNGARTAHGGGLVAGEAGKKFWGANWPEGCALAAAAPARCCVGKRHVMLSPWC